MENFYIEMQKVLNEKYASIQYERDIWEQEKEEIRGKYRVNAEVINLNIGGNKFIQTEKEVL